MNPIKRAVLRAAVNQAKEVVPVMRAHPCLWPFLMPKPDFSAVERAIEQEAKRLCEKIAKEPV